MRALSQKEKKIDTLGNLVLLLALVIVLVTFSRHYYMDMLTTLMPDLSEGTICPMLLLGLGLFIAVSIINMVVVRRKILKIWRRRE